MSKISKEIRKRGNCYWNYFKKDEKTAKCFLCKRILKLGHSRSPSVLKGHLKSMHGIDLATSKIYVPRAGPSTSKDDLSDFENFEHKIAKKNTMKEHSNEFRISRFVAKDGMSFKCLSTSEDLRYLFWKSGFSLPTSDDDIKLIVENFSLTVKDEMIKTLQRLKTSGKKFSLTFDRWTSVKNKIYLNVNVHHLSTYFNLGLIPIRNSCSEEDCVNLVKTRLEKFVLRFDTDIIGITTDDASITKKMARLLGCYRQLCFANGIHLAVIDTLYMNPPEKDSVLHSSHCDDAPTVYSSDNDTDSLDGETSEEHIFPTANLLLEQLPAELNLNYRELIEKVRKTVSFFRKSPIREACLEKYFQNDLDTIDHRLILDNKRTWSSLFEMLECFNFLKDCTKKALIELGSEIRFSDEEWTNIEELLLCLQPLKLAVEFLCRKDSNLLSADTTLRFILEKLSKRQSKVSSDLATALRTSIVERRTEMSGIVLYLHNPKKYENITRQTIPEAIFSVPKKDAVLLEITNICEKMFNLNANLHDEALSRKGIEDDVIIIEENLSLNEELEIQLKKEERDTCAVNKSKNSRDFKEIIKTEMIEYENRGIKGQYLSLVHNYLNTITPTSLGVERAFSVSNCTSIPITNKLTDETIDTIWFLRSYFKNNDY